MTRALSVCALALAACLIKVHADGTLSLFQTDDCSDSSPDTSSGKVGSCIDLSYNNGKNKLSYKVTCNPNSGGNHVEVWSYGGCEGHNDDASSPDPSGTADLSDSTCGTVDTGTSTFGTTGIQVSGFGCSGVPSPSPAPSDLCSLIKPGLPSQCNTVAPCTSVTCSIDVPIPIGFGVTFDIKASAALDVDLCSAKPSISGTVSLDSKSLTLSLNSDQEYVVPGLSYGITGVAEIGLAVIVKFGSGTVRSVMLGLDFCATSDLNDPSLLGGQECGSNIVNDIPDLSPLKPYLPFTVFTGTIDTAGLCKSSGGDGAVIGAVVAVVIVLLAVGGGVAWYFLVYKKKKAAAAAPGVEPLMADSEGGEYAPPAGSIQ